MVENLALLLTAFGAGSVTGAWATHVFERRSSEKARRIETDKTTYSQRRTVLITTNLAAFIRSDRCRENEREELAELIQNLGAGEHRSDFLDPRAKKAWVKFLAKSAECGWKRLAGTITEPEISDYNGAREEWEHAARNCFGPLPEIGNLPSLRRAASQADPIVQEAA